MIEYEYDDSQFPWQRVLVSTNGTLSYSELAPFLDEVHKHHKFVETSVPAVGNEPPAAGFTELSIDINLTTAVAAYLIAFFTAWASEDAKALRANLVDLLKKGGRSRHTDSDRPFNYGVIDAGRLRFYFSRRLSADDLATAFKRAAQKIEELSAKGLDLTGSPGPPGDYGLFWDKENGKWDGAIFGVSEPKPLPSDVWDRQE